MEIEKSKVLIQFLLILRQSGDVLFFLYARRLRGYTATNVYMQKGVFVLRRLLKTYLYFSSKKILANLSKVSKLNFFMNLNPLMHSLK